MTNPRQWQCGECGAWVDAGWSRHVHLGTPEAPSMEAMIMARRVEELGGASAAPSIEGKTPLTTYLRTYREPTRDTPPHG